MWKITKKYFNNLWNYVWGLTTVDEKAKATAKEVKRRYRRTKKELADVGDALKEVGNQIGDVKEAVKGSKRKGRKKNENK
tara:strand:- start:1199 stop:1438 length:240 start_codon:yes stop_codon:yes gene_type:complete